MYSLRIRLLLFVSCCIALIAIAPQAESATTDVVVNEFLTLNASVNLDPTFTNFSDWIELYNAGSTPVDLGGYYLTDDLEVPNKWQIPDNTWIAPGAHLLFWANGANTGLYTSFKLKDQNESVGLYTPALELVDFVTYPPQLPDISYGRVFDNGASWGYFGEPTPGAPNITAGVSTPTRAPDPQFSLVGGFYSGAQIVALTAPSGTAQIRYTLDGSIPTATSTLYTSALLIDGTTAVRARVFDIGVLPGAVISHTYLIDETVNLPVVSVVTDPGNLWDDTIGIYVEGTNGRAGRCSDVPVNWNQDWERPSNVALYRLDGSVEFQLDAGIEIFGGCTRIYRRKSLAVRGRDKYGVDRVSVPLFDDKPADEFRSIVLRNSGNDAIRTQFRDAMMHELLKGQMDIDWQGYRPVVVYLNGAYWGIHNIREKIDEDYVESNYGIDNNDVDFLEKDAVVIAGDALDYNMLTTYISSHTMSHQPHYDYVTTQMDIDEFMNYQIAQIYYANNDWPGNNVKYWKERESDGRWRWVLFDTDFGFGAATDHTHNSLELATGIHTPHGPNPPWSTLYLRRLLDNNGFKYEFMQRFASHINITFEPTRVLDIINAMQLVIAPEMPSHIARWGYLGSLTAWESHVNVMRAYANQRPSHMRTFIDDYFGNPGMNTLTVNIVGQGDVFVSGVAVPVSGYSGPYFSNTPMQLRAVPALGYAFAGWYETAVPDEQTSLSIDADTTITAVFVAIAAPAAPHQ